MITMRFNPPNVRLINFGSVGKKNAHMNDAILNNDQTNINILVNVFITFSFIKKCFDGLTKNLLFSLFFCIFIENIETCVIMKFGNQLMVMRGYMR